jgi:hypothetical protein
MLYSQPERGFVLDAEAAAAMLLPLFVPVPPDDYAPAAFAAAAGPGSLSPLRLLQPPAAPAAPRHHHEQGGGGGHYRGGAPAPIAVSSAAGTPSHSYGAQLRTPRDQQLGTSRQPPAAETTSPAGGEGDEKSPVDKLAEFLGAAAGSAAAGNGNGGGAGGRFAHRGTTAATPVGQLDGAGTAVTPAAAAAAAAAAPPAGGQQSGRPGGSPRGGALAQALLVADDGWDSDGE